MIIREHTVRSLLMATLVAASIASPSNSGAAERHRAAGRSDRGVSSVRHTAHVDNSRADVRTRNVRHSSINNVNVNRNVNVNVERHGGWDDDYHPIATAAAVTATVAVTSAVIGSIVRSVPPGCVPVNYAGLVYQQCGTTWYQSRGPEFVVVNAPY
ncbi:hypothetical protein [Cupriavidus numazuensis]|uniref:Uncharacterized protein n=1 Tax=Cupriavidus numazuensis TaxID=221992 RepID=A0ABM8TTN6_9BURK|nr:hypothetical protein [Cupriavidus numazuensis]CAG2159840.1 hypothetical protein LMG26411_07021 [Cupriavidus numazuensis]